MSQVVSALGGCGESLSTRALEPSTCSHQSTTWDGRVLNSKATVLAFLEEADVARREGRTLEP